MREPILNDEIGSRHGVGAGDQYLHVGGGIAVQVCVDDDVAAVARVAKLAGHAEKPLLLSVQPCSDAPVTRQIASPTSSATSSDLSGPMVTPTGRP